LYNTELRYRITHLLKMKEDESKMPAKQSDDIFDEHDETKSSLQNNHSEDEACLKTSEVLQTTAPSFEDEANNQHVNGYSLETQTNDGMEDTEDSDIDEVEFILVNHSTDDHPDVFDLFVAAFVAFIAFMTSDIVKVLVMKSKYF